MQIRIGDIFWLSVQYEDEPTIVTRPCVVIHFNYGKPIIATLATITSSPPKSFEGKYDQYKVPLWKWRDAGLLKPSYVKANNLVCVDASVLSNFIGRIDPTDFKRVINEVNNYLNN